MPARPPLAASALLLLAAAALLPAAPARAELSDADCPSWIADYARFHNENRNKTDGPVRRFTYSCENAGEGGGFGDRFRAIVWGARFAAATRRVLHIKMTHPVHLENYLLPNAIDWRPFPGDDVRTVHGPWPEAHLDGRFEVPQEERHIFYGGIPLAHQPLPWGLNVSVDHSFDSKDIPCVMRMLFKWTPEMEAKIHLARSELLVGSRDYTAVHLRTAGAIGDSPVAERGNPLSNLLGALHCAHALAHPAVLVATHPAIRHAASSGWFDDRFLRGPQADRVAFTYVPGEDQHVNTFVELGLLSQAKCLIANRGGFSDTARWLGGNTECVRFVGEAPWGKQPGKECFAELAESLGTTTSWT